MPLEEDILKAHRAEDGNALVALYRQAANRMEAVGDLDAACFFLTHAYVHGLEGAHPDTPALLARLRAQRRED